MTFLSAISIVVHDMAASIDFYSRLGLILAEGNPEEAHCEFAGDGVRVMLDTEDVICQLHENWVRPTGGHAMALAFQCETPADVDHTFSTMVDAGYQVVQEPWDAFWGQRYATITDPDNNPVDLFCPL